MFEWLSGLFGSAAPTATQTAGTVGQRVASSALNNASNQMLANTMTSAATPAVDTGLLSSLSGLGSKAWDVLGSQQVANAANVGGQLFSGINNYQQGKIGSKILKSQEARAADAYARDKEAAAKRQLLTF